MNTGTPGHRVPFLPMALSALVAEGINALAFTSGTRSRDTSRASVPGEPSPQPDISAATIVDHLLAPLPLPPDADPALTNLLYHVAIGRRIGYPMHLVAAKNHLFARWDDGNGVRINMESANAGGFTSHADDYYRTWPFPISAQEEKSRCYLRNLDPTQTLAVFLTTRAVCLQATGNNQEAARAAAAYRMAPVIPGSAECLAATLQAITTRQAPALHDPAALHPAARFPLTPHIPGLLPDPVPGLPATGFPIPLPFPPNHHNPNPRTP